MEIFQAYETFKAYGIEILGSVAKTDRGATHRSDDNPNPNVNRKGMEVFPGVVERQKDFIHEYHDQQYDEGADSDAKSVQEISFSEDCDVENKK